MTKLLSPKNKIKKNKHNSLAFIWLDNFSPMLQTQIESILFASDKPLTCKQIGKIVGRSETEVEVVIEKLKEKFNCQDSGIRIISVDREIRMVSSPANKDLVSKLIKSEAESELTRPQIETLTIIAYRGPISKLSLERLRGVNCSLILRNLLIKGLIEVEEDKLIDNNRYRASLQFLQHLGLNDISELPDYQDLSREETLAEIMNEAKNNA